MFLIPLPGHFCQVITQIDGRTDIHIHADTHDQIEEQTQA